MIFQESDTFVFAPIAWMRLMQEAGRNQKGGLKDPFLSLSFHHLHKQGMKQNQICGVNTGKR